MVKVKSSAKPANLKKQKNRAAKPRVNIRLILRNGNQTEKLKILTYLEKKAQAGDSRAKTLLRDISLSQEDYFIRGQAVSRIYNLIVKKRINAFEEMTEVALHDKYYPNQIGAINCLAELSAQGKIGARSVLLTIVNDEKQEKVVRDWAKEKLKHTKKSVKPGTQLPLL